MADEFVELNEIPSQSRKKGIGEFFGRMKRGYGRAKELVQDYKKSQAQKQFSKDIDREQAMERATIRAEKEAKFASLQTRRLTAQRQVYEAAAARNAAKGRYMGETMRFPIDMSLGALGRPSQPQQQPVRASVAYPRRKGKGKASRRVRYSQPKSQPSLDEEMVAFMRR